MIIFINTQENGTAANKFFIDITNKCDKDYRIITEKRKNLLSIFKIVRDINNLSNSSINQYIFINDYGWLKNLIILFLISVPSNKVKIYSAFYHHIFTFKECILHFQINEFWKFISMRIYSFLNIRKILNINFITVSHFTKNNLINNFKIEKSKIKVLWNQIFDKDILDISNRNRNIIDNSIYDPYILIVSTLLKRKNINLIEKISYIYGKKIKFVCPIPNKSKLIRKLAILKKNNVFVYHNISYAYLKRLYLNSSCVLIPSIYEGLSLIPLEAISMSKPIIMSKIKPHLYWQLPDEFYFDIGNNKKLLEKLNCYLNQQNTLIDYSTFHKFSNKFYLAQKERNESLNSIYEKDNF